MPTIIGAGDPTSGYEIDNSLRFGGDNHHLSLVLVVRLLMLIEELGLFLVGLN